MRSRLGDTHTLTQLTDEEGPQCGFLMVILDVYVDDVHRLKRLLLSGVKICGATTDGESQTVQHPGVIKSEYKRNSFLSHISHNRLSPSLS